MSKDNAVNSQSSAHIVELQSFRGLAALVVLISHCSSYYIYYTSIRNHAETYFNAHAAVVAFYVLSGFVLALSLNRRPVTLKGTTRFFLKRAYRIYPALWVASAVAIFYLYMFRNVTIPSNVSDWWLAVYRDDEVSLKSIIKGLLGGSSDYPVPLWSITVELMGSILMPLIVIAMQRGKGYFICITLILLVVGLWPHESFHRKYLICFALGASVVLWAPFLKRILAPKITHFLLLCAVLLMMFGRQLFGWRFDGFYHDIRPILLEAIAASFVVALLFIDKKPLCFLKHRYAVFLGDISYSLYLLHLPVLGLIAGVGGEKMKLAIFNGDPFVATVALLLSTLVVVVPLSYLIYRFVEIPGIKLGNKHQSLLIK